MVTLSKKEHNRLIVLNRGERGMMAAREAAEIPGLSVRPNQQNTSGVQRRDERRIEWASGEIPQP